MAGRQRGSALPVLALLLLIFTGGASFTYFVNSDSSADKKVTGEKKLFWYNDATGKSQWEEPKFEFVDAEQRTYWVDPESGASSWEKPAALKWNEASDDQGQTYYWNEVTGKTTWEKPEPLAWRQVEAGAKDEL